ncbi:MAG: alcohol dehydrogenase catalytic domain-containing protein [Planktotalea sp.]|jgi:L-gulonate 5-dehydrogenase|uniref:alcohol dehydrogenase catalytic domain-containing protein n=1 Tax=Planktotalea sp. TaxID=2029877 RepID=UPI000183AE38|nr:alcohol dehydrogenase catalytic domain-containing protein [Planktotalea sp.]EDZ44040.1 zinc-containing alcohol dehydrogenase superfamily [Rhodobacteraceae bacterium HTCC2083]MBT5821627.1 alcohol dehydrogenase catalytic domain-containing protein [Paracoccaceae bacterium]MDG1075122.1 alcohol dehydrogenase catalytic domain-containing protein [Planktotalea sp.]MDG1085395.1 alcohol dehydrogenase catalytic domain-containing protein [Planktotalea sp.]HCW85684.1 galactitol-1-phosphate 5-dehydrogena
MKALVYDGVETLNYRDMPDPVAGSDTHLIKIEAVGICGSDMHAYLGHDARRPAPLILGHEAAGTIVGGVQNGRRVTVNPLVSCGTCAACKAGRENICPDRQIISMPPREGAFAQYVAMPDSNLVTVPDAIPMDKAALAEPLAVSWHTARLALEALHPSMERRALVIGGGAIGLAAALALKAMGARDVTIAEPNDARRAFLTETCGQATMANASGSFETVIDAVGYGATRASASACVMPGGVIAHVGLGDSAEGFDVRYATLQEVTFIGTYTYTMQDFRDTAQAIFDGKLGPLDWTEKRALSDGFQAFKDLRTGKVAAPKIILDPWA